MPTRSQFTPIGSSPLLHCANNWLTEASGTQGLCKPIELDTVPLFSKSNRFASSPVVRWWCTAESASPHWCCYGTTTVPFWPSATPTALFLPTRPPGGRNKTGGELQFLFPIQLKNTIGSWVALIKWIRTLAGIGSGYVQKSAIGPLSCSAWWRLSTTLGNCFADSNPIDSTFSPSSKRSQRPTWHTGPFLLCAMLLLVEARVGRHRSSYASRAGIIWLAGQGRDAVRNAVAEACTSDQRAMWECASIAWENIMNPTKSLTSRTWTSRLHVPILAHCPIYSTVHNYNYNYHYSLLPSLYYFYNNILCIHYQISLV